MKSCEKMDEKLQQIYASSGGDARLGSILKQGQDGDIVLIGFPFDFGAKRENLPYGQDNGPDCLRRFLPKIGPLINAEYDIPIHQINIADYGNIYLPLENHPTLESYLKKLETKCLQILNIQAIPIVIGGTKDCVMSSVQALLKYNPGKQTALININNYLDLKHSEGNQITSLCSTKQLILSQSEQNLNNLSVQYFGIQPSNITEQSQQFYEQQRNRIQITTMKEIRTHDVNFKENVEVKQPVTQAGILYNKIVQNIAKKAEKIHLSLSLEAIDSCFCPGVSSPNVEGGLSSEEIIEIMFLSGRTQKILSLDITDYNPCVEDFRTGRLLGNLIYYFLMGYSSRNQ